MRDHGGNIDAAIAEFGGTSSNWVDLSTGINPRPYPVPAVSNTAWSTLPTRAVMAGLINSAKASFGTNWAGMACAGAQAGIQMLPRLLPVGQAKILAPTYNEHAASLRASGWDVSEVADLSDLTGANLAVVVNPNNPDGAIYTPERLSELAENCGTLIVDESFCDPHPANSLLAHDAPENVIVLRSFGKFYGLAGVRLGFVFGNADIVSKLSELSGPWPVSGPAIELATAAYADVQWQADTIHRLSQDAARLDAMAEAAGWKAAGGTTLFRLYEVENAEKAQVQLAKSKIWGRIFPYSDRWIRLGLPDGENQWQQVQTGLLG